MHDPELQTTRHSAEEYDPEDWTLFSADVPTGTVSKDWFPFYVYTPGHQTRVYYVNVETTSPRYKDVITLYVPASGGEHYFSEESAKWDDMPHLLKRWKA